MIELVNQNVLVAGGAGNVGEEIVKSFLRRGANVIVPSRSFEKLRHLEFVCKDFGSDRLLTVDADVSSDEGMDKILKIASEKFGPLTGVVASLGSWYSKGKLDEFSLEEWQRILAGGLTAHFNVARKTIPLLRNQKQSFYLMVNGGAALVPVPTSGPVSIIAAAQEMMKQVIVMENKSSHIRVFSLLVTSLVETRARSKSALTTVSAKDIGDYLAILASGTSVHVPGETIQFSNREQLVSIKTKETT